MTPAVSELVRRLDGLMPDTALVLGSGLGLLVDAVSQAVRIPYADLQGFPGGGVSGHAGEVVAGYLAARPVLVLSGRVHYYEKGNPAAMRVPLETVRALGVSRLVLTNAAGSLRPRMGPGAVMMLSDHINWSGLNPLIGEPTDARFVGMTAAYSPRLQTCFREAATAAEIALHEGVYMWFSGPSFETPAEIRAAGILGADAVGMSTVPEVILARFLGLECAAFSVITNFAAGMTGAELSHDETKHVAPQGGATLARLIAAAFAREDFAP
ncbi:MAG: purine nucleoside phosphorylase [Alphaproteobacteria bacterium]|nr:MAG: purine nucleoside phosphorylase [Alphaproteobacteria bacterium]